MAIVTKGVEARYGRLASLVAPDTVAKMTPAQLEDRLSCVADTETKAAEAAACGSDVLARCYHQVAKGVLHAMAPSELQQKVQGLRTKADLLGRGGRRRTCGAWLMTLSGRTRCRRLGRLCGSRRATTASRP